MSMSRRSLTLALIAGASVSLLQACGGGDDHPTPAISNTIVGVASGDARFSILVEAVVAADLVATLNSAGPFTVFAPTNDAFVALLGELNLTKEALLANKTLLTNVLTYHVVSGA
ncbi:MAG: fasciclin domain-containing protein [Hydrogenophaga sp.]